MARTWQHKFCQEHFRAKYRYLGVFFFRTAVFDHFPLEDFLKPTRVDQSVPQEPISVRNSRSTNSPNFSFNYGLLFSWLSAAFPLKMRIPLCLKEEILGPMSVLVNRWLFPLFFYDLATSPGSVVAYWSLTISQQENTSMAAEITSALRLGALQPDASLRIDPNSIYVEPTSGEYPHLSTSGGGGGGGERLTAQWILFTNTTMLSLSAAIRKLAFGTSSGIRSDSLGHHQESLKMAQGQNLANNSGCVDEKNSV